MHAEFTSFRSVFDEPYSHPAHELVLYIDNTQRLHKLKEGVWRQLLTTHYTDSFDPKRALQSFRTIVEAGILAFGIENGEQDWYREAEWDTSFPEVDRQSAVEHYARDFSERLTTGELNHLLPQA